MKLGKALISIMAVMLVASSFVGGVSASTLTVAEDGSEQYPDLESAISNAADGDTINVSPGVYYEYVETDKNLTIQNANPDNGEVYVLPLFANDTQVPEGTSPLVNTTVDNTITIGDNVTTYDKNVITVGESGQDYLSVQTAVDNAKAGTEIKIANGSYNESVNVTSNFVLFNAQNQENPSVEIDARDTSRGVAIYTESLDTIEESGDKEVYVSSDITTLDATLSSTSGGTSIAGFELTDTFVGIPYWLWILALVLGGFWYYDNKM